jgi:hypothetical protein
VNLVRRICRCKQLDLIDKYPIVHMQSVQFGVIMQTLMIMLIIGILWRCIRRHIM